MNDKHGLFKFMQKDKTKVCKEAMDRYIKDNYLIWRKNSINENLDSHLDGIVDNFFYQGYFPLRNDGYKNLLKKDVKIYLKEGICRFLTSDVFDYDNDISYSLKEKDIKIEKNNSIKYGILSLFNKDKIDTYIEEGCECFLINKDNESFLSLCDKKLKAGDTIKIKNLTEISNDINVVLESLHLLEEKDIFLELNELKDISISNIIYLIQELNIFYNCNPQEKTIKKNSLKESEVEEKITKIKKEKPVSTSKTNSDVEPISKTNNDIDLSKLIALGGTLSYASLAKEAKVSVNVLRNRVKKEKANKN